MIGFSGGICCEEFKKTIIVPFKRRIAKAGIFFGYALHIPLLDAIDNINTGG